MSADTNKTPAGKTKPPLTEKAKPVATAKEPPPQAPEKPAVGRLFRNIDWLAFGMTTLLAFIGFYLTLAPDMTLEDSGELATGSFYAGVPHPPGYPLWTVWTYLFSHIVTVGNVAYRVAMASAVAGSVAAGLLALVTSRGSSMILEGMPEFSELPKKLEGSLCVVSGFVAGMLLAFNGYMWSQSVIVEVYPFSVLSLMGVICCLLHWVYTPNKLRYAYFAWFLFGICFTNHQTLIVAAMGIEVVILARDPRIGRDLFLLNSVVYLVGVVVLQTHILGLFEPSDMVKNIFHLVGIGSILTTGWFALQTKELGRRVIPAGVMLLLWVVGAAFYFYMPITSMTNPPMNWGYPRTVEGFIHALTRGQYEKTYPTNFFNDPLRFFMQLGIYFSGATEEFNIVSLLMALVPFFFFFRMARRERSWIIGLLGIWTCLAILLMVLLNPTPDRATHDLIKVFFTASYTTVAIMIGYGLTLIGASLAVQYERFRLWSLVGGVILCLLALWSLADTTQTFFGDSPGKSGISLFFYAIGRSFAKNQYGLPIHGGLILFGLVLIYTLMNAACRTRVFMPVVLGIFALLPLDSILSHWSDNEQRGHWFGYWFGHDMFTPPFHLYPTMTRDAVLFGGTDPGRFAPTYMIFCESFIPPEKRPKEDPNFDRRDVYIITQNALADGTYLEYIRAQYNRSTQIDPPFFQELLRGEKEKKLNYTTNLLARLAYQVLDKPFLALGAKVEARRRAEGVYPPVEIYTPTPQDSETCFQEYLADVQHRLEHDQRFPNEPRLMKPGEDAKFTDNRVQVSGQVAVMSINGLLTKVIFDHNPTNEFFVEESFPLDWMYPYLTPFGIIMKINRQPIPEITEDIVKKDHDFWTKYSERLIGNWVTYDTSVKQIADFVEKVYLQRNFEGFTGDRAFIRDDDAQKAFSKLRSSIGGIYNYRIGVSKPGPEQQRMIKEADFAFRQAFAYCPYSPEAVFRYVSLLVMSQRIDDAMLVVNTCLKLDPYNDSVKGLRDQLIAIKGHGGMTMQMPAPQARADVEKFEKEFNENPSNFQAAFNLASSYLQQQNSAKAIEVLDKVLASPNVDAGAVMFVASAYARFGLLAKLETALEKLTQLEPGSPEARYDLAAMRATLGRTNQAIEDLRAALELNRKRLSTNSAATNLSRVLPTDARFKNLQSLEAFKTLSSAK